MEDKIMTFKNRCLRSTKHHNPKRQPSDIRSICYRKKNLMRDLGLLVDGNTLIVAAQVSVLTIWSRIQGVI